MSGMLLGVIATVAVGVAMWSWRAVRRLEQVVAERDRQIAQWQSLIGDGVTRVTRISRGLATPVVSADAGDPLGEVLGVVRDALEAREVIWWRRAGDGTLAPQRSSEHPAVPRADPGVAPHAAWADDEGLATFVEHAGAMLAVAPVPALDGAETRGALVARGPAEWPDDRADAKQRLERCGAAVARIVLLLESQRAASEYSSGIRKALEATRAYATVRDPERLAALVCADMVSLYGMQRAAVVRWQPGRATGHVVAVSARHAVAIGQSVGPLSAVGEACAESRQLLWQDAAQARDDQPIFDDVEPSWSIGALLVVPLVRDRAVLGALVVETDHAGGIREHLLRMITLMADLMTPTLESLWSFEDVERRARTDALTGLWNRRHFEVELARWLQQVDRYGGKVAIVLVDVDHFKRVNDSYGHETGDLVLQHVSAVLHEGARTVDVVARLGGEEFVLLLPSTPVEGARDVAERLRTLLESKPAALNDGTALAVTASFGVAAYPAPVAQRNRLVPAADAALYAAKRDGRNCVRLAVG